ncbi:MAG: DUF6283 family protein [Actinomycetia bacterium]|nr:DUF6283 family protein [Actinomycetes bacterium]
MNHQLPHRRYPCAECPWRKDTPPGQFTAGRYEALRGTSGSPGSEAAFGAPMFACHKSPEGREESCAGWLAVAGIDHLGIRLAVARGHLPASALAPGDGWPELFAAYDDMAAAQGRDDPDTPGR